MTRILIAVTAAVAGAVAGVVAYRWIMADWISDIEGRS